MGAEGSPPGSKQLFGCVLEQHWSMAVWVIESAHALGAVATGEPAHRVLSLVEGGQVALTEMCVWYE